MASMVAGAALGIGCSSDDSSSNNKPAPVADASMTADATATDGAVEASSDDSAACTPEPDSVATIDAGTVWACAETKCAAELQACAADCECNNGLLGAFLCVQKDAGTSSSCFVSALTDIGPTAAGPATTKCLLMWEPTCKGDGGIGGGDSGAGADGSDSGGDAATTIDSGDAGDAG